MVDDDDGVESPSLEPRTDSRSALPRGFRAWRQLRIVKRDESFFYFSLHESKYMELELRSVDVQGAREAGGAPRGRGRTPTLVDRVWAPWRYFFCQYFLLILKSCSVDFQVIPRTFISPQKLHHGNSAENNVSPG